MLGGVNMRKTQIYIKNHKKTLKNRKNYGGGGCCPRNGGGVFTPSRGVLKHHWPEWSTLNRSGEATQILWISGKSKWNTASQITIDYSLIDWRYKMGYYM